MTDHDLALAKRAVTTTMIAAIAAFEEFFSDLVNTSEFIEFRSRVLHRGNGQCRILEGGQPAGPRMMENANA